MSHTISIRYLHQLEPAELSAVQPPTNHNHMKTDRPLNPRQERFAQLVAQGHPASQAYVEAGYSGRHPDSTANGCLLLKIPRVAARVAEIQSLADSLDTTLLTILEKRRFLAELVRTPIGSIGPDSRLCQELYEKKKPRSAPADGNTSHTTTEGDTELLWRRVKMADKLRAIELDSKLAGHFPKPGAEPEDDKREWETTRLKEIQEIANRIKIVSPLLIGQQ